MSEKPLLVEEWAERIKARAARKLADPIQVPLGRVPPGSTVRIRDGRLMARTRDIGQHWFPPAMRAVRLGGRRRGTRVAELGGFRPAFLPLRPLPRTLPRALQRRRFLDPGRKIGKSQGEVTSIFAPDERYTFSDTSFPWCTCGLVTTGAGNGSGVMIGPRHLMTASHVINWGPNNTAGWLKFAPLSFDGSEPFGSAYGTTIYWWVQADTDHDGRIGETETAFDYVVVVLDARLGDTTGWMGSRGYDDGWNGGAYWGHVGYPGDLSGGQRPAFIGYQAFDDTFSESTSGEDSYGITHRIDVWPGQSGGPYFGWWDGDAWPRVVGIQSTQNWGGAGGPNTCGGGNPLPDLISYARSVAP